MPGQLLEQISHVQVPVADVHRAVDWYRTYLGCEVLEVHRSNAILRLGSGPTIFLWQTADQTVATFTIDGEPFPTIGIETRDMERFKQNLQTAGVEMCELPGDIPERRFLKFFDPDGNMFVIHQEPGQGNQ